MKSGGISTSCATSTNTTILIVSIIGVFGGFVLSFVLLATMESPIGFAVPVLSVLGIIVSAIMRHIYGRGDVENRRYELLGKVVHLLSKDMAPDAKFTVEMDLNRPDAKSKYVDSGQIMDWKVQYYADPWLTVQGQLLDGAQFRLAATENYQHRSKWKRNPRGKMKHKTKSKSATLFNAQVRVKTKRFPNLGKIAAEPAGNSWSS